MNIRKIIILLLLLKHPATQPTETIAQTLSSLSGETIIGLNLSINDLGHAMAVWGVNNSGSYSIQAAYFNGTSWSPATTISDGDGGLSPWVSLNNSDKAVAAWQTNLSSGKVKSNTFVSGSWVGAETVQDPATFQTPTSGYPNSRIRVGVDPLGNAVVVWLEVDNSATPTQYFLQGAFSPDFSGNSTGNANNWNFYPHITLNTNTSLEVFFDPNSQVFFVYNVSGTTDAFIFTMWTQINNGLYSGVFPSTNIHTPFVEPFFESTTYNASSNCFDFNLQGYGSLSSVHGTRIFRISAINGIFSECDLSAGATNLIFNFWTNISSAPKPLLHQAASMQQQATAPFPQPGYRIALQSSTNLNCSALFQSDTLSIDHSPTYPRFNAMINSFYDNTALLFWNSQGGSPANNRIGIMQYDGTRWDTEGIQFINANLVNAAMPSNDLPFYVSSSQLTNNGQHYVGLIWWDSIAGQVQSLFGNGTYAALLPSPANNLAATSADCSSVPKITIQWALSPDSNISNQYVYRNNGPGTPFSNISGTLSNTAKSFEDVTISAGITYQYFVRVENTPGLTSDSVIIADQCINNKPNAVTLNAQCALENGAVAVNLTWTYAGTVSVQKFQIYRSSQSDLQLIADNIASTARSYKDTTNVEAGSVYVYYAYAVSTAGISSDPSLPAEVGPCNVDSPPAPSDLNAQCNSSTSLTLTWIPAPSSANITSQSIYRDGQFLASVSATADSYTDSTILPDAIYTYEIKSVAGNPPLYSEAVVIAAGGCVADMPASPSGVTATCTDGGINVTWSASTTPNITLYNIYRYGYQLIATVNIAENGGQYVYKDTQVETDINYYYGVTAISSEEVESNMSSSNNLSCEPNAPEQIKDLSSSCVNGAIILTWTPPDNNTRQEMYRDNNLIASLDKNASMYTDNTISSFTDYTYFVRAFNGSASSNSIPVDGICPSPDNPDFDDFTCDIKDNDQPALRLQWQLSSTVGIVSQNIYRNNRLIANVGPSTTSFLDTSIAHDIVYSYRIAAVDGSGTEASTRTKPISCTLVKAGLVTGFCTFNQFALQGEYEKTINWKIPEADASHVLKQEVRRDGTLIAALDSSQRQYVDHNRPAGISETYTITVYSNSGSNVSSGVSITC